MCQLVLVLLFVSMSSVRGQIDGAPTGGTSQSAAAVAAGRIDPNSGFIKGPGYPIPYSAYENPSDRYALPVAPEVPGFYLNAGFNKAVGLQIPPLPGVFQPPQPGYHTPLGELFANKIDLLPSILKTGFFVTVVIIVFKIIAYCFTTLTIVKQKKPIVTLASHVPIVALETKSAKLDENLRDKREPKATPVVDAKTDFDSMISQLDGIVQRFNN